MELEEPAGLEYLFATTYLMPFHFSFRFHRIQLLETTSGVRAGAFGGAELFGSPHDRNHSVVSAAGGSW